jgi:electron transport complex protein RnfG
MSTPAEPAYRKRTGYQAGLLGGFATMAAVLLVMSNMITKEDIQTRQREDLMASLEQVIPPSVHDNDLLADTKTVSMAGGQRTVYRAMRDKVVTALAYQVTGYGYAGAIQILMSVNAKGEILGVRVLAHAETPGLGDQIETAKSDWIFGFNGLSLDNTPDKDWAVKKDGGRFDQFSGATITPRGVVKAIKEGLEFFRAHKGQLLAKEVALSTNTAGE